MDNDLMEFFHAYYQLNSNNDSLILEKNQILDKDQKNFFITKLNSIDGDKDVIYYNKRNSDLLHIYKKTVDVYNLLLMHLKSNHLKMIKYDILGKEFIDNLGNNTLKIFKRHGLLEKYNFDTRYYKNADGGQNIIDFKNSLKLYLIDLGEVILYNLFSADLKEKDYLLKIMLGIDHIIKNTIEIIPDTKIDLNNQNIIKYIDKFIAYDSFILIINNFIQDLSIINKDVSSMIKEKIYEKINRLEMKKKWTTLYNSFVGRKDVIQNNEIYKSLILIYIDTYWLKITNLWFILWIRSLADTYEKYNIVKENINISFDKIIDNIINLWKDYLYLILNVDINFTSSNNREISIDKLGINIDMQSNFYKKFVIDKYALYFSISHNFLQKFPKWINDPIKKEKIIYLLNNKYDNLLGTLSNIQDIVLSKDVFENYNNSVLGKEIWGYIVINLLKNSNNNNNSNKNFENNLLRNDNKDLTTLYNFILPFASQHKKYILMKNDFYKDLSWIKKNQVWKLKPYNFDEKMQKLYDSVFNNSNKSTYLDLVNLFEDLSGSVRVIVRSQDKDYIINPINNKDINYDISRTDTDIILKSDKTYNFGPFYSVMPLGTTNEQLMPIFRVSELNQLLFKDNNLVIFTYGYSGSGKCHSKNTPILMFDGTIKMVQNIKENELLMGDDSTARKVLSTTKGRDLMYEIRNDKGDSYTVNSEHILCLRFAPTKCVIVRKDRPSIQVRWFDNGAIKYRFKSFSYVSDTEKVEAERQANEYLETINENKYCTISVEDFLNLPKAMQTGLKGYATGVEFKSVSVPLKPYLLGVWLGDGTSIRSEVTNIEEPIIEYLKGIASKYNCEIKKMPGTITYKFISNDPNYNKVTRELRMLNLLGSKHIPHIYKCNSRKKRLQLLAGIIDTDGYYDHNCYEITQKLENLAIEIQYLARSLGFACNLKKVTKYCDYKGEKKYGTYYKTYIYGSGLEQIPTLCTRKQGMARRQIKDALVSNITIIPKGEGKYYGFELDGNHKYVLGNFIVTHNTYTLFGEYNKSSTRKVWGLAHNFIEEMLNYNISLGKSQFTIQIDSIIKLYGYLESNNSSKFKYIDKLIKESPAIFERLNNELRDNKNILECKNLLNKIIENLLSNNWNDSVNEIERLPSEDDNQFLSRFIKTTSNNKDSSRGFLFITLSIKNNIDGKKNTFTLIDMAGSEDSYDLQTKLLPTYYFPLCEEKKCCLKNYLQCNNLDDKDKVLGLFCEKIDDILKIIIVKICNFMIKGSMLQTNEIEPHNILNEIIEPPFVTNNNNNPFNNMFRDANKTFIKFTVQMFYEILKISQPTSAKYKRSLCYLNQPIGLLFKNVKKENLKFKNGIIDKYYESKPGLKFEEYLKNVEQSIFEMDSGKTKGKILREQDLIQRDKIIEDTICTNKYIYNKSCQIYIDPSQDTALLKTMLSFLCYQYYNKLHDELELIDINSYQQELTKCDNAILIDMQKKDFSHLHYNVAKRTFLNNHIQTNNFTGDIFMLDKNFDYSTLPLMEINLDKSGENVLSYECKTLKNNFKVSQDKGKASIQNITDSVYNNENLNIFLETLKNTITINNKTVSAPRPYLERILLEGFYINQVNNELVGYLNDRKEENSKVATINKDATVKNTDLYLGNYDKFKNNNGYMTKLLDALKLSISQENIENTKYIMNCNIRKEKELKFRLGSIDSLRLVENLKSS